MSTVTITPLKQLFLRIYRIRIDAIRITAKNKKSGGSCGVAMTIALPLNFII